MKRLYKLTFWAIIPVFLLTLNGCKSGESMIKCPELSAAKKSHPIMWAKIHPHTQKAKSTNTEAKVDKPKHETPVPLMASTKKDLPISIKIPALLTKNLTDADQQDMNDLLAKYSANRISIQKRENGKMYVSAASAKDLFSMGKNVSGFLHPRGYYERRYADNSGMAVASAALGIVGFVFSFIPILNLVAILFGIVAIILGALSLNSGRPRMAMIGLIFGILALVIGALMTLVYLHFLFWL